MTFYITIKRPEMKMHISSLKEILIAHLDVIVVHVLSPGTLAGHPQLQLLHRLAIPTFLSSHPSNQSIRQTYKLPFFHRQSPRSLHSSEFTTSVFTQTFLFCKLGKTDSRNKKKTSIQSLMTLDFRDRKAKYP